MRLFKAFDTPPSRTHAETRGPIRHVEGDCGPNSVPPLLLTLRTHELLFTNP